MQYDHVLTKLNFLPFDPKGRGGGGGGSAGIIFATMLLQHDHVLKKFNFDL